MRRVMFLVLAVVVLWVGIRAVAQEPRSFPHTKPRGRATIRTGRCHSGCRLLRLLPAESCPALGVDRPRPLDDQPSHDPRAGQSHAPDALGKPDDARGSTPISRRQFPGRPSSGRTPRFGDASSTRISVRPRRSSACSFSPCREKASPSDTALLDNDRVTIGEVFFEMPSGEWETGTYALVLNHPLAHARLPITLE